MRFYKCVYPTLLKGTIVSWHTCKDDAYIHLRNLRRQHVPGPSGAAGVVTVHFSTLKKDLLVWLNKYVTTE